MTSNSIVQPFIGTEDRIDILTLLYEEPHEALGVLVERRIEHLEKEPDKEIDKEGKEKDDDDKKAIDDKDPNKDDKDYGGMDGDKDSKDSGKEDKDQQKEGKEDEDKIGEKADKEYKERDKEGDSAYQGSMEHRVVRYEVPAGTRTPIRPIM